MAGGGDEQMNSIRTKFTLLTLSAIIVALSIVTYIGVYSIKTLGKSDADQMLHLKCTTGATNLETYFNSVENSVETVSAIIQDNLETMPPEKLGMRSKTCVTCSVKWRITPMVYSPIIFASTRNIQKHIRVFGMSRKMATISRNMK